MSGVSKGRMKICRKMENVGKQVFAGPCRGGGTRQDFGLQPGQLAWFPTPDPDAL